ncbi:MAG: hypothetical protein QMC70_01420 [Bacteroidia bacterium]|jgi:hypothetical protein|tara:strand:+ start:1245 stop:1814 length:570 start_codon:yes stop_codon:yes gene_type:complete
MGKPRHSKEYYDAVTPEGLPAHYNRKNWEDRETFVNITRNAVIRSNVLKNKGFIKGAYTDYKSPNQKHFQADHGRAIKDAHRKGGFAWSPEQKKKFTHDVSNIVMAVSGVNRAKGYKGIDKWTPPRNLKSYLLRTESTDIKYGLSNTKKEAKVFKNIIGRKPNVKIRPNVENTKYCASCHINHSAGKHK